MQTRIGHANYFLNGDKVLIQSLVKKYDLQEFYNKDYNTLFISTAYYQTNEYSKMNSLKAGSTIEFRGEKFYIYKMSASISGGQDGIEFFIKPQQ
jgi:hypothetical protein